jgi:hypothetical protein
MTLRTLGFCLVALLPAAALASSHRSAAAPAAPATAAKPATAPAATPAAPSTAWESYRILSERNIFMRYRSKSGSRQSSGSSVRAPVSTGDEYFVLTGIIQQGEDCVAFIEDTRTAKTSKLQAGDPLGRGRLTLITQDIVHYACDGDLRRIAVGCNFIGAAVSLAKPVTTTTTASAASVAAARAAPGGAPGAPPAGLPPGAPPAGLPPGAPPAEPGAAPGAPPTTVPGAPPPPTAPATGAVAGTLPAQPPTVPAPAAAGAASSTTSAGSASIELQMRLRREQELNK